MFHIYIKIMNTDLSNQTPEIPVSRATNAPHYEYLATVGKCTTKQYRR